MDFATPTSTLRRAAMGLSALLLAVTSLASAVAPAAASTILGLSVNVGPSDGGTTVVISGSGFQTLTDPATGAALLVVKFGGTRASIHIDSESQITAVTPAHAAGVVDVVIVNADGTTASAPRAFRYVSGPSIATVTPAGGAVAGGNTVTISGNDFGDAPSVSFGAAAATSVAVSAIANPVAGGPTQKLTVKVPAGVEGSVPVTVATDFGTSTLLGGYTYSNSKPFFSAIAPAVSRPAGGTSVKITGSNLQAGTQVLFDGVAATSVAVAADGLSLTAVTPAHDLGPATVSLVAGAERTAVNGVFTYAQPPTITSITPTLGANTGGTVVTITGSGFLTVAGVAFAGVDAKLFRVYSDTSIGVVTPQVPSTGRVAISLRSKTGVETSDDIFTYGAGPYITSVSPDQAPAKGGTRVTITGGQFKGATGVSFGGRSAKFTVKSATSIVATLPAGVNNAKVTVAVRTALGVASLAGGFTYKNPTACGSKTLGYIEFEFRSLALTDKAKSTIAQWAATMSKSTCRTATIARFHIDVPATADPKVQAMVDLSNGRADAVQEYLQSQMPGVIYTFGRKSLSTQKDVTDLTAVDEIPANRFVGIVITK